MAASFQATPASGTILVDNADNAVFRPFIPEIAENNNERNRTGYEYICCHYAAKLQRAGLP
jgi:hypothetical protein